jgi:hypothetical protein
VRAVKLRRDGSGTLVAGRATAPAWRLTVDGA